ncbi:alpha-glucan family phosphorylase, partial [bacterium]|nr:alpha-glucan family phosphorylase [bacterium]
MKRVHTVQVVPKLPEKLAHLREIAMDMHWSWHPDAIDLFRRLDQDLWRAVDQNPVLMLARLSQSRLDKAARDGGFLSHLERVWLDFEVYRSEQTWYNSMYPDMENLHVAYFSAEFGLHESLPIYSGGLGILSGDHLKAASDLGVPLTGIGLMYQKGYFRQYLNADGWQQEKYPEIDVFHSPMKLVMTEDGSPLEVTVRVGSREVALHVWRVKIGRINLYLLDSNVLNNHYDDRRITEILYGGDSETRIRQEIVLGIGGIHALEAMGIKANVFHMNEGHSAFMALERIRRIMSDHSLSFEEAREAAIVSHGFTTHTPVPAGIDKFSQDLMEKYFGDYWPSLGLDRDSFMRLGGVIAGDKQTTFNMAIMAIGLSTYVNGVSNLHAQVSRQMWHQLWPM